MNSLKGLEWPLMLIGAGLGVLFLIGGGVALLLWILDRREAQRRVILRRQADQSRVGSASGSRSDAPPLPEVRLPPEVRTRPRPRRPRY